MEWKEDLAVLKARDEFVLCAGSGNAAKLVIDSERTLREVAQQFSRLAVRQFAELRRCRVVRPLRRFVERDCTGAVAADLAKKAEGVLWGQAQDVRDAAAHAFVRKKVGKECGDIAFVERFCAKWQCAGERDGGVGGEIVREVAERQHPAVVTQKGPG